MRTLLSILVLCISIGVSYPQQTSEPVSSIRVLNVVSDTIILDNRKPLAVIFAGGYACSACYGELERAIQKADSMIQIVILLRLSGSSVVSRKEEIKRMERLVRSRSFYFDITSQTTYKLGKYDDGLFGYYQSAISPSVLFLLPGCSSVFVDYSTLFNHKPDAVKIEPETTDHCLNAVKEAIGR